MEKKFSNFSLDEAARLAKTPVGQQLIGRMQSDQQVQAARESAEAGDAERVKQALGALMDDPQTKALLRQLWEEYHG